MRYARPFAQGATMKNKNEQREPISRRKFIAATVAGGAAVSAAGASVGSTEEIVDRPTSKPSDPLAEMLAKYGSEFGDLRQTR